MKTIDPKLDDWPRRIAKPDLIQMERLLTFIKQCSSDKLMKRYVSEALKNVKKALARIG